MSAHVIDGPAAAVAPLAGGSVTANETGDDVNEKADATKPEESFGQETVINRDPDDVRLILQMSLAGIVLSFLLVGSVATSVYLYTRGPMLIFKNPEDGRVLQVNNTVFGNAEPVKYGQDRLTDDDKLYIVKKHAQYRFALDPATRAGDLEKMFKMMVPQTAVALFEQMKGTRELERQAAEKQQGVWTPQIMKINSFDPYKIDIIGTQTLTRLIAGNNTKTDSKQISFSLKLVADPHRRADRNERSGFLVADIIDYREFGATAAVSEANGLQAQQQQSQPPR